MNKFVFRTSSLLLLAWTLLSAPMVFASGDGLVPILRFAAGFLNQGWFPESDLYTTDDELLIEAADGVELSANIFVPTASGGLMPAVILINSWGMNEYQYLNEAAKLAEQGYVVLSYATRGFGSSGGLIDTAGPKDISDFSTVVDFLLSHYPVDPHAIGSAGISYGSGISLLGAAADGRIKAVAAMSSWGSLEHALYGNQTPHLAWGEILMLLGELNGRPDPIISQHWNDVKSQNLSQIPAIRLWTAQRSPDQVIEQLNASGTAVYFGKAYGDNLFQPNTLLAMFSKLTVPKHIDLVQGTHATAEIIPSLLGIGDNRLWDNSFKWLDIHLKGLSNDLSTAKPVQMKVKFKSRHEGFDAFPPMHAQMKNYYLHPRHLFDSSGDLKSSPYNKWYSQDNTINSWAGTLMFSTQIPAISQLLEQLELPVLANIPAASKVRSIYFDSGRLSETMAIRGSPSLSLQVQARSSQLQLVAYLYDMDVLGTGKLITHGVITVPDTAAGRKLQLDFELVTTAYDVPAGHRLVVAFDTTDPQYKAPTSTPYSVDFEFHRKRQSLLRLPVL